MRFAIKRLPLSLVLSLAWLNAGVSADELQFSGMEQRLATLTRKNAAASGVQTVSFLQDTELPSDGPIEVQPPRELGESSITNGSGKCDVGCECNKCSDQPIHGVYYSHVELLWMRSHMNEGALGKLSEKYELTPRFVIGYEDAGGVGTRVRYWTYGRVTPNLSSPVNAVRFDFDVLDLEATSRFGNDRSELVVGGGLRWADLRVVVDDEAVAADMPGITFAVDLRTMICRDCYSEWYSEWASIAGARWSLLGGDWEGSNAGFLSPERDDNIVVTEIYGGVEYIQHYSGYDLFLRLVFEVQHWHSDVAAQTAGVDSIGFVGPGLHVGMNF